MPATLVAEHVAPAVPFAPALAVGDLSNGERSVALYASDLPNDYRYQRGDDALLIAWIIQGANRVGLDRLRRTAALDAGFWRSRAVKRVTSAQKRAQSERFPDMKRERRAGELAALITLSAPVSEEARERGLRFLLDGACPECGDTRQVWRSWCVDVNADWYDEGYGPCFLCGGAA
ncbi:hypothetical protein ACIPWL_26475 [Streptomyces sp. NPDC090023]|uniref:hypothetical protein n=1 Tax=unclassified Streptomyces TaxID=2593676 RepID=UPI0038007940